MLRQTLAVVSIAAIVSTMHFSDVLAQVGLPPFFSFEAARAAD